MNADRRRDIERDEQWLRRLAKPCPSAETLDRVKLAVRQAYFCDGGERVPGIDEAVASAKMAVREELGRVETETSRVLVFLRWVPVTAVAAVVGFALIGDWQAFVAGGPSNSEIQRLADVMDHDPDDMETTLAELAMDIADLEEDAFGTADMLWGESLLDGLGNALDDLLSEPVDRRETS